eukprot:598673-Pelagomonas_calceolata.AAC.1
MPALLCAQAGSSACTRLLFVELHYAVRQRHDRKAATESQEPPTTCGHAHAGASAAGTARGLPTRTSWLGPCGRTTRYYLRLPLLWRQQGAPAVHPTHSTPWALQCRSLGGLFVLYCITVLSNHLYFMIVYIFVPDPQHAMGLAVVQDGWKCQALYTPCMQELRQKMRVHDQSHGDALTHMVAAEGYGGGRVLLTSARDGCIKAWK